MLLESQIQNLIFLGLVKQRNIDDERDWTYEYSSDRRQEYIHNAGEQNTADGHLRNRKYEGNILMGFRVIGFDIGHGADLITTLFISHYIRTITD